MMRLQFLLLLTLPAIIMSCARQSSPTGGPKDTIPPVLVTAIPANETVNYDGRSIELLFSEPVTLANPKEQIMVIPTIGKEYEIEARKNRIILTLAEPLQDSTTYSFIFRDAVQDITEKNPARNLKLAISTGSYIDSMTVQGKVLNVLKQKPLPDITVVVQPYADTFDITKHPASYFTKSEKDGTYKIDNLKPGIYHVYAIADQNKNLIADTKSESYGFKKDSLFLDHDISKLDLGIVRQDLRPLKLTSARPFNTYFNLKASKNLKSFVITAQDSLETYASFGTDRSSIVLYNSFGNRDSTLIHLQIYDSIDNKVDTTLYAKFTQRAVEPEKFSTEISSTRLLSDRGMLTVDVTFSKPLRELNFDSISFTIDSAHVLKFTPSNVTYDEPNRRLTLKASFDPALYDQPAETPASKTAEEAPIPPVTPRDKAGEKTSRVPAKPKVKNKLNLGYGAFISIESDSSAAISQNMTPSRFEDLGVIIAETKTPADQAILQLVDKSGNIRAQRIHRQHATFEDLQPDNYELRLILDRNKNGVWDPGNYLLRQEPEPIYYWLDQKKQREIKLKANYEIGPLLITY